MPPTMGPTPGQMLDAMMASQQQQQQQQQQQSTLGERRYISSGERAPDQVVREVPRPVPTEVEVVREVPKEVVREVIKEVIKEPHQPQSCRRVASHCRCTTSGRRGPKFAYACT